MFVTGPVVDRIYDWYFKEVLKFDFMVSYDSPYNDIQSYRKP